MITVYQIVLRGGLFCFGLDTPGPQFREISRERGRRSPAGRSQRLRPPWGPHTFARQSRKAGRGCSPSGAGLRASAHPPGRAAVAHGAAAGGVWRGRGGNPRAHTGEKPGCRGRKRTVVPGNGAQRGRSGRHPECGTGQKPGKPGVAGAVSGASGGVFGAHSGVNGAKTAAFRGCGRQKGREKPSTRWASGGKLGAAWRFSGGV